MPSSTALPASPKVVSIAPDPVNLSMTVRRNIGVLRLCTTDTEPDGDTTMLGAPTLDSSATDTSPPAPNAVSSVPSAEYRRMA